VHVILIRRLLMPIRGGSLLELLVSYLGRTFVSSLSGVVVWFFGFLGCELLLVFRARCLGLSFYGFRLPCCFLWRLSMLLRP